MGSPGPTAVDGAEVCFAPALRALECSILGVCAGGSKCFGKSISTVNHKLCLELWGAGGLVHLLESPRRDSIRKIV